MPTPNRLEALRTTAEWLIESGAWPVRLEPRKKKPVGNAWGTRRVAVADFREHDNIGIRVGAASSLVDVDLDCDEARAMASRFLPPTTRKHGREAAPVSHYWYRVVGASPCEQYQDPTRIGADKDKAMLVEFRGGRASEQRQTMVPPSIHPSGETLAWSERGEPGNVDALKLLRATRRLASAVLLARHWPGARHHASLALCGALARASWPEEEISEFVTAIAAWVNRGEPEIGDGEPAKRRKQARDSLQALAANRHVTGMPTLSSLGVPLKVIAKARQWLELPAHAMSGNALDDEPGWRASKHQQRPPDMAATAHAGIGPGGVYRLTDLGNARRFADAHKDQLRYVNGWRRWVAWDGRRWRRDDAGAEMAAAKEVVAAIYVEAAERAAAAAAAVNSGDSTHGSLAETLPKWARQSATRVRIDAMVALARSEPELATARDVFDRDPWSLNVMNGTIDLRDGNLRPSRREDMITMLAPVEYDPIAPAPLWETFVERVLPDAEVRSWVQRYLGYAVTGDVREQCLAFFVGAGANGKSLLVDVVLGILGDYGLRAAPDLVLAKHGEAHPTELADLEGKRFVVCSEIEQGRAWAESTIKRVTGDATITARRMRQDFYTFSATHKLVVAANTKPTVRGTDDGIWRRMRLVPWTVQIPEAEQDRELPHRLLATEASGILAWLVRGCIAWQNEGLNAIGAIACATAEYRADQDVLTRWLDERCTTGESCWDETASLYGSYRSWCSDECVDPLPRRLWRERLLERNDVLDGRKAGARGIRGIQRKR